MSAENPFNGPPQEAQKPDQLAIEANPKTREATKEEEERNELFIKTHPEAFDIPETKLECEPEIAKFKEMIASFEAKHSLEELHAITDLTPEEAPKHPLREPARVAIIPIDAQLKKIKEETNITPEQYEEMRAEYKRLTRAIGMINKGKVDHTR